MKINYRVLQTFMSVLAVKFNLNLVLGENESLPVYIHAKGE